MREIPRRRGISCRSSFPKKVSGHDRARLQYALETDWLAEDAVSCEPVSAPNSLLTGKLTGNFAESGPSTAILESDQRAHSIVYSRIPCATEQGISKHVSGKIFQG